MTKPLRQISSDTVCRMFFALALAGGTSVHAKWLRSPQNAKLARSWLAANAGKERDPSDVLRTPYSVPRPVPRPVPKLSDDRLDDLPGKKRHATVIALSDAGFDEQDAEQLCKRSNAVNFVAMIDAAINGDGVFMGIDVDAPVATGQAKKISRSKRGRQEMGEERGGVPFDHLSEDELHRVYLAMAQVGFNKRHVNWICNASERFVRLIDVQIETEKKEWIDDECCVLEAGLRRASARFLPEAIDDVPGLVRKLLNEAIAGGGGVGRHAAWIRMPNRAARLLSLVEACMRANERSAKEEAVRKRESRISNFPTAK